MNNKKLIVGIAAGVAAMAVVGVILKRKGKLDGVSAKADALGHDLKDRFQSVKESAKRKYDEVVLKGGDIAEQLGKSKKSNTVTTNTNTANANKNKVADTMA